MTSGLSGQALALCKFCKHRRELNDALESRDWLRKENARLRKVIIEERKGRGKYPVDVAMKGDLVEDGRIW